MVSKRKRNLKVDNNQLYTVLNIQDINIKEVEDYNETRDTGMEADEEKEIHLQNIIKGDDKNIPLPVIKQIKNESRSEFSPNVNEIIDSRINNVKDSQNKYIESEEDKAQFSSLIKDDIGIPEMIFKICDDKNAVTDLNDNLVNFCIRRGIVRYDRAGFEAYACFRNRIFHPTFKSRRNEALMTEKIERLGLELSTLKSMCKLLNNRLDQEYESLKITKQLVKCINSMKSGTKSAMRKRKTLYKRMVAGPYASTAVSTPFNVDTIMTNRDTIRSMKNRKIASESFLDLKYYNEVMRLINKDEN